MTKYISSLNKLAEFLKEQTEPNHEDWFRNFLIRGYTAPLVWVSTDLPRSSVINHLYQLSDEKGKVKIENTLKTIYNNPRVEYSQQGFIELMICISLLNLTSLFPDIYRLALMQNYKNVKSEHISPFLDVHTYILKTLFGFSYERGELKSLTSIAKRDILDNKYMLECFTFLMYSPKNNKNSLEYLPYLLMQIPNRDRDYEGAVFAFLDVMGENELISKISEVIKILEHQDSNLLLNVFQNILSKNGISISENLNPDFYFELKIRNKKIKVPQKLKEKISICFRSQENIETKRITDEILMKNGRRSFLNFMETLAA